MKNINTFILGSVLLAAACSTAFAEEPDHARWFVEDATPQARYQTMKKEAYAGQREAMMECRTMRSGERAACTRDANANFRIDMANAKRTLSR
jgi:hypothetical protein